MESPQMNPERINDYLRRSREILGERSAAEIAYDSTVADGLDDGLTIQEAISAANLRHPSEALKPRKSQWADVQARYEYIAEHKRILKKLGMHEK
jgi:hypothetical protein